jgi:uncharacterized membrane protein YhaH (DUF805 family)
MRLLVATALLHDADDAAGAVACAGCWGFFFLIIVLTFVLQIAILVWVARDAKTRGMDAAVIWMLFVFLVPVIGLLVYVFSRPQGVIVKCAQCNNSRLQTLSVCPYCGRP